VRRLRGGVDDRGQALRVLLENLVDRPGVANVDLVMLIVRQIGQQFIACFPG
jgi:hypothetical protein